MNFDTLEGRLLYTIYTLYLNNRITLNQKNEMKDLLITSDLRMIETMQEFREHQDSAQLESSLINLTMDSSPMDFEDTHSIGNTYKGKRPKKFFFAQSNFLKLMEAKNSLRDTDSVSKNSNSRQEQLSPVRQRNYSLAADSC